MSCHNIMEESNWVTEEQVIGINSSERQCLLGILSQHQRDGGWAGPVRLTSLGLYSLLLMSEAAQAARLRFTPPA